MQGVPAARAVYIFVPTLPRLFSAGGMVSVGRSSTQAVEDTRKVRDLAQSSGNAHKQDQDIQIAHGATFGRSIAESRLERANYFHRSRSISAHCSSSGRTAGLDALLRGYRVETATNR